MLWWILQGIAKRLLSTALMVAAKRRKVTYRKTQAAAPGCDNVNRNLKDIIRFESGSSHASSSQGPRTPLALNPQTPEGESSQTEGERRKQLHKSMENIKEIRIIGLGMFSYSLTIIYGIMRIIISRS
jgi:hypothetical protein